MYKQVSPAYVVHFAIDLSFESTKSFAKINLFSYVLFFMLKSLPSEEEAKLGLNKAKISSIK